jgi:molybdate transport system substrate-binding protein
MAGPADARSLSIACAANFTSAMKELVVAYEKQTGVHVTYSFGSTGMLYGQIINGAPYDVYFAADKKRPNLLFDEGLAFAPIVYAKGTIVAWSISSELTSMPNWKQAVSSETVYRVAIANPKTAPYGKRAKEALISTNLYDKIKSKLAYGKNVGASFQFAYSKTAEIAFIALSQALSNKGAAGRYWHIPEAQMVEQAACILKNGNVETATDFLRWLHTPGAQSVIEGYGYE